MKTPDTPSTFRVDDFGVNRATVCVRQLWRSAVQLDEDHEKKEDVLKSINQAVLAMSSRPATPPMRHYKHLVLRQALVQLCDDIGQVEWRIRRDLHLLNDPRFQALASFPQDGPATAGHRRRRSKKSVSRREHRLDSGLEESVDWDDHLPRLHKKKLEMAVYARLSAVLVAMLPIMTFDGYRMNPMLPRPEL